MSLRRKAVAWSLLTPLVLVGLIVILLLTFDWNRLKPWLNQKVSDAIGRPFAINGDLVLTWRSAVGEIGWRTWVPWPRLSARDITVGNPDWAREPNLLSIGELVFVLRPLPLLARRIEIPRLVLDSPTVWLERLADQRNNWTFTLGGGGTAPHWGLDVDEVVLTRGNLALSDKVQKIELQAAVDTIGDDGLYGDRARDAQSASATLAGPAASSAAAAAPPAASAAGSSAAAAEPGDSPYGIRWKASGRYNQATISGSGKAGSVLSLRDSDTPFPLQADVRIGNTRVALEGTLTNPAHLAALDVRLQLSGDNLARLYPLTGITLPTTPPYETRGRLRATLQTGASVYRYENFSGRLGGSDLSGSLTFAQHEPRPLLSGKVASSELRLVDLAPLIGADAKPGRAAVDSPVKQPAGKALPVAPFRTERWDSIDADVTFAGKRIVRDKALPVTDLHGHLLLRDGVVTLDPLDFGVAGGSLVSTLKLDGKRAPLAANIDVTARHLKLKQLFPTFESMKASLGELNGSARLGARGNSVAAMLGSANGEARLLVEDGTISKFLLEAMGLNVGSVVLTKLFGDKPVRIRCGVSDLGFDKGIATARTFVLDTDAAVIRTTGAIDLSDEKLALTVRPEAKGVRLLSLNAPLYVGGTFQHPSVSPDAGVLALRAGSVIALAVLAPVATAILPLTELSSRQDSQCSKLLGELQHRPGTPVPPRPASGPSHNPRPDKGADPPAPPPPIRQGRADTYTQGG